MTSFWGDPNAAYDPQAELARFRAEAGVGAQMPAPEDPRDVDPSGDSRSDFPSQRIDLPGGHTIWVRHEVWLAILKGAGAEAAVTARAQAVCDEANASAVVPGAEYEVRVSRKGATRVRAYVTAANPEAVQDENQYATLLKAAETMPSDPFPQPGEYGMPEGAGSMFEGAL